MKSRFVCRQVPLKYSQDISLSIFEIGNVTDTRYGALRDDCFPAVAVDLRQVVVERGDIDDIRGRGKHLSAPREGAVDAGLAFVSGCDEPVIFRPLPLVDFPAEDAGVEVDRSLGFIDGDLKVNYPWHKFSIDTFWL